MHILEDNEDRLIVGEINKCKTCDDIHFNYIIKVEKYSECGYNPHDFFLNEHDFCEKWKYTFYNSISKIIVTKISDTKLSDLLYGNKTSSRKNTKKNSRTQSRNNSLRKGNKKSTRTK